MRRRAGAWFEGQPGSPRRGRRADRPPNHSSDEGEEEYDENPDRAGRLIQSSESDVDERSDTHNERGNRQHDRDHPESNHGWSLAKAADCPILGGRRARRAAMDGSATPIRTAAPSRPIGRIERPYRPNENQPVSATPPLPPRGRTKRCRITPKNRQAESGECNPLADTQPRVRGLALDSCVRDDVWTLRLTRRPRQNRSASMTDTFWTDLLVALIATTFGAILTVGIAFATYRYEIRSRERDAIHHLANVLASRRALLPARSQRVDASLPAYASDLEACVRSVQYVRDAVVDATRAVRPGSKAQYPLDSMARATNDFLSSSRSHPDEYWLRLNELRGRLIASLDELSTLVKRELPQPGSRGRSKTDPIPERAA